MKNLTVLSILFLFLGLNDLKGATFIPTPLEDQVKDSHGVIRGIYKSKTFKKNKNGEVITEATFLVKESSGLKPGDIVNKNNFKVTYPGGSWQGISYRLTGSPEFKQDEEVILLIYRGDNGFHLLNFGLGKYSLKKESGVFYLKSNIFPNNNKISGVKLDTFQSFVKRRFGRSLEPFRGEKFVYTPTDSINNKKRNKNRKPASLDIDEEDLEEKRKNSAMFWLMLILAGLGTMSYRVFNKKG